jgi:hypothetical protein
MGATMSERSVRGASPVRGRRVGVVRSALMALVAVSASVAVVAVAGVSTPVASAAPLLGTPTASSTVITASVASVASGGDVDSDLQTRLVAACARIGPVGTRIETAIARLDAPASSRGSLAWFTDAVARATSNGRPRIAADLQRRLDRLTLRRTTLDIAQDRLESLTELCTSRGAI